MDFYGEINLDIHEFRYIFEECEGKETCLRRRRKLNKIAKKHNYIYLIKHNCKWGIYGYKIIRHMTNYSIYYKGEKETQIQVKLCLQFTK